MTALWVLLGFVIASLGGMFGTLWLARRVWKRRSELTAPTKAIAIVCAVAAPWAAVGTLIGVVKAFGAVGGESVDPSQKARILAEGISEAMNCMALGVLVWIPSAIVVFILSRRKKPPTQRE